MGCQELKKFVLTCDASRFPNGEQCTATVTYETRQYYISSSGYSLPNGEHLPEDWHLAIDGAKGYWFEISYSHGGDDAQFICGSCFHRMKVKPKCG